MCNDGKHKDNIIFKRNGTDQEERFNSVLDPANLELHDFDLEDWLLFAYNFAKHINFFETNDNQIPSGDWQELFNHFDFTNQDIPKRTDSDYQLLKNKISKTIEDLEAQSSITPHMTLFICFLRLLEFSKQRFNRITKRHLDFFYKEILQIEKLPATEDKAHIIFELAKKSVEERVIKETALDGGKDANGNKLIYKTTEELIANKAKVGQIKSLYNDINLGEIKYSSMANSLDGLEEALPDDANYWLPFGYTSGEKGYTELPDARLGFAIASPMFDLKEGERNIDITITFTENINTTTPPFTQDDLLENLEIQCSGEEGWLGVFQLGKDVPFNINGTDTNRSSGIFGNQLRLVFQISKDTPPILKYDNETLGENFTTTNPIIRFLIKTDNQKGHVLFRKLVKKTVSEIKIRVDVRDIKSLTLDSDKGVLNPNKPFYPFTTQPVTGSSFKMNYPEVFLKKWETINVNIKWKNTPDSFVKLYEAYKSVYLEGTSRNIFMDGMFIDPNAANLSANQPEDGIDDLTTESAETDIVLNTNVEDLIVQGDDHFKARVAVFHKEEWDSESNPENVILFEDPDDDNLYETNFSVDGSSYEIGKSGPLRLTLNQSFLHFLFPRIYTLALSSDNDETLIPNDPYTPFADVITFNYSAEENTDFTADGENEYGNNRIQLFHEDPFGQYEEHSYLKIQAQKKSILTKNADTGSWIVPDYCHGGELYIGLEEAEVSQQISLLVQILEGSENPDADSFVGKQRVEWAVLCNNQWMNLEESLLNNGIDNFLKSGIVKFSIPKQATKTNTRLPKDFIWIRAKMHKDYDAVCKVIDIMAQVVLVQFENNNNELAHLYNGLPAESISKLISRVPQIKGASQPYNSFDGKPLESDDEYYRRISERLRHKNRAITLWDYEHLIMQEFPEVFRVKCLNHTSNDSFLSPGDVTLVAIPDIVDKNVFDIFEPRLSTATLNKIQNFINQLNTMHVEAVVMNPQYEQVLIRLNVKFYEQYDENFYQKQLNEDLVKFLSPWAFDTSQEIVFGIELNRSALIDYVEKLFYVDYLSELEMAKHPDGVEVPENPKDEDYLEQLEFVQVLSPTSPKHILVSAKNHLISTDIKVCDPIIIEEAETCQY
ncbi:phage baseplate protein [Aquimarina sp. AD1]|uniref:baseplate J/gp47 family protein n=1 Tax=Aquimarina sp. (strain AD1) TaxID=1714848 RepID=UPI000E479CC9|nr:baseplate J/gp47 family protein [Aquimarina sp. AD1]AXT55869.1 phage baseplate protein [Aquimarina sp. AD1]RKN29334.1 phage baseplate protein [Aquimarina sp. AD1]